MASAMKDELGGVRTSVGAAIANMIDEAPEDEEDGDDDDAVEHEQKSAPRQHHDSLQAVGSVNGTDQKVEQKEQMNLPKQQQPHHHHHHQQQQQQQQQQELSDLKPTTTMSLPPALNGSDTCAVKVETSGVKGVQVSVGSSGVSSEPDWKRKVP
jgi:hypothetical protein